jgi:hypothetical protein
MKKNKYLLKIVVKNSGDIYFKYFHFFTTFQSFYFSWKSYHFWPHIARFSQHFCCLEFNFLIWNLIIFGPILLDFLNIFVVWNLIFWYEILSFWPHIARFSQHFCCLEFHFLIWNLIIFGPILLDFLNIFVVWNLIFLMKILSFGPHDARISQLFF